MKLHLGDVAELPGQLHFYTVNSLIKHPLASPITGFLGGLPPLLFITGDDEVLRDEIIYTLVPSTYFQWVAYHGLNLAPTKLHILKNTQLFRVPVYYVLTYKILKKSISLPQCIYRFMMVTLYSLKDVDLLTRD